MIERMNNSGDAAEQVMRMSLEGAEVAVKLTGTGALKLAQIIYATLKQQNKTKGKSRLTSMLRSGKALKVFTVKEDELKRFSEEAKRYGVLYCVLRDKNSPDGNCDVMVRAEDASKINRIVERFKLAAVDTASVKAEITRDKEKASSGKKAPIQEKPEKSKEDKLVDDLMSKPVAPERNMSENPFTAKTEKSVPSEPTSRTHGNSTKEGTVERPDKQSVRAELKKIQERRRSEKKSDTRTENRQKVRKKSNKEMEK